MFTVLREIQLVDYDYVRFRTGGGIYQCFATIFCLRLGYHVVNCLVISLAVLTQSSVVSDRRDCL